MDVDVDSNAVYYRKRAVAERTLAREAPADDIRDIHLKLAERYADLASEFEERSKLGRRAS